VTLVQTLRYFLREASLNLLRGWRISSLAVATIGISLFVVGSFFLVTANVSSLLADWGSDAKVTVYLQEDVSEEEAKRLADEVMEQDWVEGATVVSREEAVARFEEVFPRIADAGSLKLDEILPFSLELELTPDMTVESVQERAEQIATDPRVEIVDDDRQWQSRLLRFLRAARVLGTILGLILLIAAVFTIASVIRLSAHLYRDEIAVMRLVGATELVVRGPFYLEGLMQGVFGGVLALTALYGSYRFVRAGSEFSGLADLFLGNFLPLQQAALLVVMGGLAGLLGALLSLRSE